MYTAVLNCMCVCVSQDGAEDGDDEDKYAEDMDMPGQKFETKNRITVRNLRIREDTAKVSSLSSSCLLSGVIRTVYFGYSTQVIPEILSLYVLSFLYHHSI